MQLYFGELVHKGRFKYYCAAVNIVMPSCSWSPILPQRCSALWDTRQTLLACSIEAFCIILMALEP